MTTTTQHLSDIDRKDRLAEMQARLAAGVQDIQSTDDWLRWLDFGKAFWNYSFNNVMLIMIQRPDATLIGGAGNLWDKKFNRKVIKGERAIWILAPMLRKTTDAERAEKPYLGMQRLIGWKPVPVFDVSQTEGDPLPEHPAVEVLEGEAPVELFNALVQQVRDAGFTFAIADMPAGFEQAHGLTDFNTNHVTIKRGMSQAQTVKTTAHELAHVLLHAPKEQKERQAAGTHCREDFEVEAESVAYLVLGAHGVATDGYSFGYVAGWAGRNTAALHRTGERVMKVARKILDVTTTLVPVEA